MPTSPSTTAGDESPEPEVVLQFKITLLDISPTIWRRIVVPEVYTFWDLHVAIQDAMGWLDYHLHRFEGIGLEGEKIEIGIPDFEGQTGADETEPGWELFLPELFIDPGDKALYVYDFGDNWHHEVLLEGLYLAEEGDTYPRCIGGERACPPEDCGSIPGYYRLLEVLENKKHPEYMSTANWLEGHEKNYFPYSAELFEFNKVQFRDPQERWCDWFEFVDGAGH